jgi:hypothetical protein
MTPAPPVDRLTPRAAIVLIAFIPILWPARLLGMVVSAAVVGYLAGYRYVRAIVVSAVTYHD